MLNLNNYDVMKRLMFTTLLFMTVIFAAISKSSEADDPVVFMGIVYNQDGDPIAGAQLSFCQGDIVIYETATDADGCFRVCQSQGSLTVEQMAGVPFNVNVSATDYPSYESNQECHPIYVSQTENLEFLLSNKMYFHEGEATTIFLAHQPLAEWGAYYELKSFEPAQLDKSAGWNPTARLILSRTHTPQAGTPYVIIPASDFTLTISDADTAAPTASDTLHVDRNASFVGTYKTMDLISEAPFTVYHFIGDSLYYTSDNGDTYAVIAACRAYFRLPNLNHEANGLQVVYEDDAQGIENVVPSGIRKSASECYDLQGHRLFGLPTRGIYVTAGRKQVVK